MATVRYREKSKTWEFVVKRAGVLDKPKYFTFTDRAEGERYCAAIEKQLDKGKTLPEIFEGTKVNTVGLAIVEYLDHCSVKAPDEVILRALGVKFRETKLSACDYEWMQKWVQEMKRIDKLAPQTISHKVGALSRCFDYCVAKKLGGMLVNPRKLLARGWATYNKEDVKQAGVKRTNVSRERRLDPDEEKKIRAVIAKHEFARDLILMFALGIESAMRMRETYTLLAGDVNLKLRTIFLRKTKNGNTRQVPLTSVAIKAIQAAKIPAHGPLFPALWNGDDSDEGLVKASSDISEMWAKVFEEAGCPDFHYHDLRHEATSRLYERTQLSDLQISKITGHTDLKMLARYANLRGSDLAAKLW